MNGKEGYTYARFGDEGIAKKYKIKRPGLSIIKHEDDLRVDFTGNLTDHEEVNSWIS